MSDYSVNINDIEAVVHWFKSVTGEERYPTYDDKELTKKLNDNKDRLLEFAKETIISKMSGGSLRLGDLTLSLPEDYFKSLLNLLRNYEYDESNGGQIRTKKRRNFYSKVRADGT